MKTINIRANVYDKVKYLPDSEKVGEAVYNDVVKLEVKIIPDEEILKVYDCTDDYQEYVILTFADGSTNTFRNSYVDMFREW